MSEVMLENVGKIYPNGVPAVRDLNLTVAAGEMITLIGPSGCGKTTTLRLIAGLEEPTEGVLRLNGQIANGLPPRARDVALVFQKHNLYPHLTVRRNLSFGLRLRHPEGRLGRWTVGWLRPGRRAEMRQWDGVIAERVAEAARVLELEDVLERRPRQLSGGQQQRVALGRALVRRPAIWLLDEPLSHLDAPLRAELRRQLHLLHRRLGATMIYVTHDQLEAMTLGQRLVVMNHGEVQQVGPPEEVYWRPRNRFVAGFVGWPPMNFVDGRLVTEEGRLWFGAGDVKVPVAGGDLAGGRLPEKGFVTLGIRPEQAALASGNQATATVTMEVALVEPLGSASLVTCQRGDWRLTALDGRMAPAVGRMVEVRLDMSKAFYFDTITGLTLNGKAPEG